VCITLFGRSSSGLKRSDVNIVHHQPFSKGQIEAIRRHAEKNDWIGPVVVVGIETGLRLGDAVTLKWSSVDLGFIDHKCRKTKHYSLIPISPKLRGVPLKLKRSGAYVLQH
jgi:integrase